MTRRLRTDALQGSWLAGVCLATAGMGLHHKLMPRRSAVSFGLPHAATHTVVLPHVIAYNAAAAAPEAMARATRAQGNWHDAAARTHVPG